MRSITLKLVFAFLAVSLVSVLLIVVLARYATGQEFQKFTEIDERSTLMTSLEEYYIARGSWEGIETADLFVRLPAPNEPPPSGSYNPLTVTDPNGTVIRPGSGLKQGDVIEPSEFERAAPIKVDGRIVGYLVFAKPPFEENSPEKDFLDRTTLVLVYSALGAIVVALLLGILLSRSLTSPIRELTLATHAVSEGDLSQRVRVRSSDELGELARAFNKMSAELARSVNVRRQMTADVAHELRTPLSVILGHAEAFHDGVLKPTRENFEVIREEAGRLEHLVDDLRTLSIADAGELTLNPEPLSARALLEEAAARYRHELTKKRITVGVDASASLLEINADRARLAQVLTNVLDNAVRYTPEGGRILMTARAAGEADSIEIAIEDSGLGVAGEDLDRIFDRFYRTDPSRQRADNGSGLGLAIARSIVQAHGGDMKAEGRQDGGLRIMITLPIDGPA